MHQGLEKLSLLLRNKKTRNFFIYGFGQAVNVVSPLVVIPYIVAVCGEEGFGKVGLAFSVSLFLILIVDYAFDVKGVKEASERRDDKPALEKLYVSTLFIKLLLFLMVAALFLALVFVIPFLRQEELLFTLSLSIVFAQVFTPVWFFQGTEQYVAASIYNILSKGVYLILVYIFINTDADYVYVNLFLGGSALFFNLLSIVYIIRKHSFQISFPSRREVTALLRADFSFCVSQLFISARQLLPVVFIGYFLNYYVAGQYKIIEQVITSSRTFIQVFNRYFYPMACYRAAENQREGFRFWKRYSLAGFLLVTAGIAVIAFSPEQVLHFFNASPKSIEALRPIFSLSLFVPLLMAVSLALEQLMLINFEGKAYIRIVLAVTIVSIVIMAALLQRFKLTGVIVSFIVAEVLFIALYFKNSYLHLSHKTSQ